MRSVRASTDERVPFGPQDIIKGIRKHFWMHHIPSENRLCQAFGYLANNDKGMPLPEAGVKVERTCARVAAHRWVARKMRL